MRAIGENPKEARNCPFTASHGSWKPNSGVLLPFSNEKDTVQTVHKRERPVVHEEWEIYQPSSPRLKRSPEKRIKEEQRTACDGRTSVF